MVNGVDFDEYFDIIVKKDILDYKAGDKVNFTQATSIVFDTKESNILSAEHIERIKFLHQQGYSYRDIAKLFNVSHTTVYRVLKADTPSDYDGHAHCP
jgi:DNA invertase Pin-like site-specific DNA recombinase